MRCWLTEMVTCSECSPGSACAWWIAPRGMYSRSCGGAHVSLIEIRPGFTRPTDTEMLCSPGSACSCWTAPLGHVQQVLRFNRNLGDHQPTGRENISLSSMAGLPGGLPLCGVYSRACAEYRNAGEIRRDPAQSTGMHQKGPCLARRLLRLQGCPASSTGWSRRDSKHECAGSLELFSVPFCFLFASGFNKFRAQPGLQLHLQRQLPIDLTDGLRLLIM